jgi:hypothetical protein
MQERAVLQAAIEARKAVVGAKQFLDATIKMGGGAKKADKHIRTLDARTEKLGRTAGGVKRALAHWCYYAFTQSNWRYE